MPVRGVLLDLDGTLVDTNAAHVEAWRRTFQANGYAIPADRIRPEVGKGGDQLVPDVIGEDGDAKDGEALRKGNGEAFVAIAAAERLRVFPGAVDLVRGLKDRGVRVALATSSKPKHLKATADSCGVDFAELIGASTNADDAENSKPAPDLVHAGVAKLGLPAAECVLVGDTPYDGQAAAKAGVAFWGVTCGGCFDADALRKAGAVGVWAGPAELLAELDRLVPGPGG